MSFYLALKCMFFIRCNVLHKLFIHFYFRVCSVRCQGIAAKHLASKMSSNSDVIKRSDLKDDYELLQQVGSGTYGEVYKGRCIRTGETVAIKVKLFFLH